MSALSYTVATPSENQSERRNLKANGQCLINAAQTGQVPTAVELFIDLWDKKK